MPLSLSDEEIQRYRRQLSMPEIGTRGQQHLKQATILIAGLGGLGSISAYYMAAAGVGQLKIADSDQVASHNLNRQILHTTVDIGKFKTVSACEKLKALNPWCHIDPLAERISDDTVGVMVSGCDLILDGTDNIGTACLQCIFPGNSHRSPEVTGVIGPAVGVIASLQCVEAVKILTGNGADLSGTLVRFHGLGMRMEKTIVDPDPACIEPCGSGSRHSLHNYHRTCSRTTHGKRSDDRDYA
jgi:molybdopterin/thiamine biosynthesis adenylyltransferase